MTVDNFIWIIIIVLAYGVSVLLKNVRAASKPGHEKIEKGRPEWKAKLDGYLSRLRQELEAAKQKDTQKGSGWERVLPPKDLSLKETRTMDRASPAVRQSGRETVPLKRPEPIRKEISPGTMGQILENTPSMILHPSVSGKKFPAKDPAYGIQNLRRAVVWSEILAPPLALRDKYQGFWR